MGHPSTESCLQNSNWYPPLENLDYSLFKMVMCIPLTCISNRHELVQTYLQENVEQMTHVIFCKVLYGGFILGESESV